MYKRQVLACVSYPGYDNNRLANQMDNKYYYKIYNNASLPLFNRATHQLSATGSTFKHVTLIAGLEEGVIDESTMVECDGVFDKVDPPLKCWNHAGHGAVNGVDSALKNSCNDYLCEVSYRLGKMCIRDSGYSLAHALQFSPENAAELGWPRYGDPQYVPHVQRYYSGGGILGVIFGNGQIVQVAKQEVGSSNGEKYWRWYGFDSYVEWCACFVSWCGEQAGLIESLSLIHI